MSTATLTKKELFVQGSLTTDVAEMIEMLAVNVPGVKSCNVNASNKSLVLSIDTTKDEGAVINELSSLIKTMDSSLKLTTSRQENKNNSKAQRKSAEGDKNVSIILGGLNCAHCAEVIGQKVEDLDEVEMSHLNFVNKKLSFELKDGASRKLTIDKVINIIDTTEPGLNIQVHDNRGTKELKLKLENLTCKQCADQIEFEANKANGVKSATLDFGNCILDVELDGTVSRRVVTEEIATIAGWPIPKFDDEYFEESDAEFSDEPWTLLNHPVYIITRGLMRCLQEHLGRVIAETLISPILVWDISKTIGETSFFMALGANSTDLSEDLLARCNYKMAAVKLNEIIAKLSEIGIPESEQGAERIRRINAIVFDLRQLCLNLAEQSAAKPKNL